MLCEYHSTCALIITVLINILHSSICIVSIIRIVSIKQVNLNSDFPYDGVLDTICSALEPTLGVVNACLPILQPAASKISDSTMLAWSKLRSSSGTSRGGLGSQETPSEPSVKPKSRSFRRIPGDLYPLTDVTATQSHCSGPGRGSAPDTEAEALYNDFDHHRGIEVKQFVGVESTAVFKPQG